MANKVRYGIENVHYALIGEDGTFETPKALKGAVSLTMNPEGESNNFYADNCPYVTFTVNAGYTGELTLATLEDEDAVALLNEVKDANGMLYEDADAQPASFAMLFEISGNVKKQRFALYNCTLTRPSREANTTTETTDPDTVTLSFTAIPLEMEIGDKKKKVTKSSIELSDTNSAIFDAWFTTVQKPAAVSA